MLFNGAKRKIEPFFSFMDPIIIVHLLFLLSFYVSLVSAFCTACFVPITSFLI